jgi:hypothetical protein
MFGWIRSKFWMMKYPLKSRLIASRIMHITK